MSPGWVVRAHSLLPSNTALLRFPPGGELPVHRDVLLSVKCMLFNLSAYILSNLFGGF